MNRAVGTVAVAALLVTTAFWPASAEPHSLASAASRLPVLGASWGGDQEGYGQPHPANVSNGGDPTGQVRRIRWASWGKKMATGTGTSTYVWPGTGVANNPPVTGARIVAFHLGTCRGQPSYNAVEWFYPRYGESFDPAHYINACTGTYEGIDPRLVRCPNVAIEGSARRATTVYAVNMTCKAARPLIAHSSAARFVPPRRGFFWHFIESGYRCGTAGDGRDKTMPLSYECARNRKSFLFDLRIN